MEDRDEQSLIAPLRAYAPFARFWWQQRQRLRAPLVWKIDPNLMAEAAGCNTRRADGSACIRLRAAPVTVEDASTVCHEVGHSLLDQEGWPSVGCWLGAPDGLYDLAVRLNMLLDIEIDRRLLAVGFRSDVLVTIERAAPFIAGPQAARFIAHTPPSRYDSPAALRVLFRELLAAGGALGRYLTIQEV